MGSSVSAGLGGRVGRRRPLRRCDPLRPAARRRLPRNPADHGIWRPGGTESGGRVVLTSWEPLDFGAERLPGRLQRVGPPAALTAAGFGEAKVYDRPGSRARERAMWEEAAALDPGDDPALRPFHDEVVRALKTFDLVRRVIATATKP
jgi:hypothetical protein